MAARQLGQPPEVNAYEEERRLRIQRNQEVLQGLGLLDNPLSAAATAVERQALRQQAGGAAKRRREEQAAGGGEPAPVRQPQPQRRSRRIAGEQLDDNILRLHSLPHSEQQHPLCRAVREVTARGREERRRVPSSGGSKAGSQEELDRHNIMRIRSMSELALRRRIWKITRVDKLRSFIQMLDACCLQELAAEARQALQELTGGLAGWESDEEAEAGAQAEEDGNGAEAAVEEEQEDEAAGEEAAAQAVEEARQVEGEGAGMQAEVKVTARGRTRGGSGEGRN